MWRICSRALVNVGMVKPYRLVKPVSATVVAGRSLTQQEALPTLPVPTLQQSCDNYLNFMETILDADEKKRTKELVEEFRKAGGVGERLQRAFEERSLTVDNWFTDLWIEYLFLHPRLPLLSKSNFGILFPRKDFRDKQDQIRCAAEIIVAALHIKTMIDNDTLPVEYMRGKPLCMKQYEHLMSCCLIPGPEADSLEFYANSSNPPRHITVVHNCQFFMMDPYNSDGTPLTVDQLCVQLERICNSSPEPNMESVGILTTEHRDSWNKTYTNLIKDKTNKESVSTIQSSIFTVSLNGAMPPVPDEMDRSTAALQLLHGGGSQYSGGNGWLDKGLQFTVAENGVSGALFFHGITDGIVAINMCDYITEFMKKPHVKQSPAEPLPVPQKLDFNITPEIKKDIEEAKKNFDILTQDMDLRVKTFDHFGRNCIKGLKLSPDAFVQMAIQLASNRLHQRCFATTEPASLRMYKMGRLGGIMSNSAASAAFVKAFDDPKIQNSEKVDLLRKATEAHVEQINMVITGQDTEIHLRVLCYLAVTQDISIPDFFTDPSFEKVFSYKMSTGQVMSRTGCMSCIGFGQPGFLTVIYSLENNYIDLMVCNSKSYKDHNATRLMQSLEDALLDMRTLVEQTSRAE